MIWSDIHLKAFVFHETEFNWIWMLTEGAYLANIFTEEDLSELSVAL